MSQIVYFWHDREKPVRGELIQLVKEEDGTESVEIKTEEGTIILFREEETTQWYNQQAKKTFVMFPVCD